MATKNIISMKRLMFVLGLLIMVVSTQFNVVQSSRALRSVSGHGSDHQSSVGVVSIAVSSNKASTRSSVKSLAFRLASGPSKRGPGH